MVVWWWWWTGGGGTCGVGSDAWVVGSGVSTMYGGLWSSTRAGATPIRVGIAPAEGEGNERIGLPFRGTMDP